MNLSKETQIDTLKENRVLRTTGRERERERGRVGDREGERLQMEALLKTSVMCTHQQRKQT